MTTNDSGKLNMGGVNGIKSITSLPPAEWTDQQRRYLNACLSALAHQPNRWLSYQDWGAGGPVQYLADKGIEFWPRPDRNPLSRSYYEGCGCGQEHWRLAPGEGGGSL